MKQIFTLFLVLSLSIVGYGQTFKNKPLISKRTADWCPNCGTWGWDFKLAILDEISAEDATIIALHHSTSGIGTEASGAVTDALGGVSQPKFFLNNTDLGASSGNWTTKLEELKTEVATMNAEIPDFGIELHSYLGASANEIVAEIALHVNQAVEGEYYLATYLITNDLVSNQAGNAPDAVHKKILLEEFSGTSFGREIGNGPILEGVMDFSITTTFDEVPEAQTDVAVIIWKLEGEDYTVVNTGVIEGVELLSSNDEVNWVKDATAFYAQDAINLNLQSERAIGEYRVNVLNANGQIVKTENNLTLENNLDLQINANGLTTGNYFINVLTSNGIWSDKIVVIK